jgi:hypothetical protein
MKPLVDYSKDYIQSENKLYDYAKKKIIAYVENEDDVPFWWDIFDRYAPNFRFSINPSTRVNSLERGKESVLKLKDKVGDYLILCIDSDYDYLLQGATETSKLINDSPYIFQTYSYAIENYKCYAESLKGICVKATCNDEELFDFVNFFRRYSRTVYELFLYSYHFRKVSERKSFTLAKFGSIIAISKRVGIDEQGEPAIKALTKAVVDKITHLKSVHPDIDTGVISDELKKLGVEEDNVYLFIEGHVIYDNVTLRVLRPVIKRLRNKKSQEFKDASASERKDQVKKINEYENEKLQRDYETLLATNTDYHSCFLMRKIQADVEKFKERLKNNCVKRVKGPDQ